jgi:PAS domain S-box-containing protein
VAVISVAAATTLRLALDPLLGDRFPFLAVFLALVFTACYGGAGPTLLALMIAWVSVDQLFLQPPRRLPFFSSRSQLIFGYVVVGTTIVLLGELIRVAQKRARESAASERQAVESLRANREWLRITLASIGDAVLTSDADGLVNSLNAAAERLTGWRADEATGRPLEEVLQMHDGSAGRPAGYTAAGVGSGTIAPPAHHAVLITRDGSTRDIDLNPTPITDERSQTTGLVIIFRDITDRKRAEEKLRDADRRKEEFLAVLSHELRNPLAPIQTSLDLMEQAAGNGDGFAAELATIRRQVGNLQRLVDDLLDVSRISRGTIELRKRPVDLRDVIAHSTRAVRPLVDEQHQELNVTVPDQPLLLDADPTRLEQILSNLLINAARYTPHGGKIWLAAERSEDAVIVRLRDNGIGIEPEFLGRVFDLFVQGKRRPGTRQDGVGIGLSLVKDLVTLHGGTIKAESQGPGQGSEFVVELPPLAETRLEINIMSTHVQAIATDSLPARRVLIVDDNVPAADSLGKLMSEVLGQQVRVVYDGRSALEMAISFRPEIILLDLEMSVMDGYEVAMRLRDSAECPKSLLVAVTGWGHEEDRRRALATGFDRHLVKPVTARDLKSLLADFEPKLEGRSLP